MSSLRSFARLPIFCRTNLTKSTTISIRAPFIIKSINSSSTSSRTLSTSSNNMASQTRTERGQAVSDLAKQDGGMTKGSKAAQLQSQLSKERNLEEAAGNVGSKLSNAPETVTSEDASLLHSREGRVQGGPTKGDLASQAQSVAAANEQGATGQANTAQTSNTTPAEQSQLDREANYVEAADQVGAKLATDPESVTKEEGDLLHSRETKAFGTTAKGGIASQAQSQAAQNAGDKA